MYKIIKILTHEPQEIIYQYEEPEEYIKRFPETEYLKVTEKIKWVGFFKDDFHHKFASYILKISPDIKIECWRHYGSSIKNIYQKEIDGILHKVFPSNSIRLKKICTLQMSKLMLEELKKEISNENVIIHFYGSNDFIISYLLNRIKPINSPIILQHLGWSFLYFEAKYYKNYLKLLPWIYQKRALKFVDLYLTASKIEEKFMKSRFTNLRVEYFYNGIDFFMFPPITKSQARYILNIPEDDRIILYVGRYNSTKNVKDIIDVFIRLRTSVPNLRLFLVGGYENDEYYHYALRNGADVVLRKDQPLNNYYAAADVYVLPIKDKMHQDFAGFGTAPLEALAYNLPVVSANLKHFNGTDEELNIIGIQLNDINDLYSILLNLLINNGHYLSNNINRREIVKKHFNIYENSKKLIEYYKTLISK